MARRKITFGDWARGSVQSLRNGTGMNPLVTQRFVNASHDERVAREAEHPAPSREDGYYSMRRADGSIDIFIGLNGDITAERPHVHIVHSPRENRVIFTVTNSDGSHPHTESLPADASGNQVNAVVARLTRQLH